VRDILIGRLAIAGAVAGADFHFGQGRKGTPAFLREQGALRGFAVDLVPPFAVDGKPVSSSAIREALGRGEVREAGKLLGYPWFIEGVVIHGDKRGRHLGYPTANVAPDPAVMLGHGIYAVRVLAKDKVYDSVASFGRRPTFGDGAALLEPYLFDFSGDLYDENIAVAFIDWIRPEQKFESPEALVRRMDEDARLARARLAEARGLVPPVAGWGRPKS
jgi:riboflavin kinase / FMN adenylyltransferase